MATACPLASSLPPAPTPPLQEISIDPAELQKVDSPLYKMAHAVLISGLTPAGRWGSVHWDVLLLHRTADMPLFFSLLFGSTSSTVLTRTGL